jgi:hypothetical protein
MPHAYHDQDICIADLERRESKVKLHALLDNLCSVYACMLFTCPNRTAPRRIRYIRATPAVRQRGPLPTTTPTAVQRQVNVESLVYLQRISRTWSSTSEPRAASCCGTSPSLSATCGFGSSSVGEDIWGRSAGEQLRGY